MEERKRMTFFHTNIDLVKREMLEVTEKIERNRDRERKRAGERGRISKDVLDGWMKRDGKARGQEKKIRIRIESDFKSEERHNFQ